MEKFNVMPEEKAKKKMDALRPQLEPISPWSKKNNNPSETVTRFFETISIGIQVCLAINCIDRLLDYHE
jgi:hypothetical protein